MRKNNKKQDALDYHANGRPGKIEVVSTKPTNTQRDLSLAYSPGVAEPCLKIAENKEDVYKYTAKGNLVAVVSNGTAVLGLGNIGPEASKPVMEGKGVLFKIFADIDVFDLEVNSLDVDHFVSVVKALEPSFGGINLEDIKAPECFEIERRLRDEMQIPVMHDDQHGTAIISSAALINACHLQRKKLNKIKMVVNGAGAAAISCARLYVKLGVDLKNIIMLDKEGVITISRTDLDVSRKYFAKDVKFKTLEQVIKGADVFIGLSAGNVLTGAMVKTMADNPIVFAMANPTPEISYEEATAARKDIIMATGRSDYPNQVNNVLGFPYIFRGALDVRATTINEEMKIAAVYAIAELAKKTVPESVNVAYGKQNLIFGKEYIIPKPVDSRLLVEVSSAVAKAAIASGVAKINITDWDTYKAGLAARIGEDDAIMRALVEKAKSSPKRVVFAEADNYKILKAAQIVKEDGIAEPILLGNKSIIDRIITENKLELEGVEVIDILDEPELYQKYADFYYQKRMRKGVTPRIARRMMKNRNYFGAAMVAFNDADAFISGLTDNYAETIRPALQLIGTEEGTNRVAGMYLMITDKGPIFFGDTTVNVNPDSKQLLDITLLMAKNVEKFNIKPRIAILSYSNFGSNEGDVPIKIQETIQLLHKNYPEIIVDGEMQGNFAINAELLKDNFPFSKLGGQSANTLIFPNLESGNIAYKLLQELGGAEAVGPVLLGLKKSVHILQLDSSVREIVNMVTIAVVDAQEKQKVLPKISSRRRIFNRIVKKK